MTDIIKLFIFNPYFQPLSPFNQYLMDTAALCFILVEFYISLENASIWYYGSKTLFHVKK